MVASVAAPIKGVSEPKKARKKTRVKETLSDRAYEMIKERLVSAHYAPGQFLQEATICVELKLGRTPIHQALHRLQQEGLVEIIPRKGIFVRVETLNEIFTALDVRALVEPYCAAQCAVRATPQDLQALKTIIDQYSELEGVTDKSRFMDLDRRFHSLIAQVAGNQLIVDFLRPIHERMSRLWFLPHWQMHDYSRTGKEHDDLMTAFVRHDAEAAAEAMRVHIESLRMRLVAR